ncbi:sigma 54-interacting transcriptional regulator [Glaciimonas soli]|uniref:AAA domain-containing protein n=1 Tax=Glaciimonas soli TaxID=2590999 RepID=A0A843YRT8_9BURK|nr:sigma 54-interacting transcriptional regulator [Glaciimonas soli]MQR00707.1 AAA domain-containing protein [Glaciimonas soli]
MINSDFTIPSPSFAGAQKDVPLLALSIAWHPDAMRIGEQFLWADPSTPLDLSRFEPLFRRPGGEAGGLAYGGISRAPLRITQSQGGIVIQPSGNTRMALEINGNDISESTFLSHEQITAGAVLSLGRMVVLCLHWMHCLPRDNPVDGWLGIGSAAIATRDQIRQVAKTDVSVLLMGETGTGKEVAARGIHRLSRRAKARLVSVNMATLNESLAAADLFGATRGAYTGAQTARSGLFAEAEDSTLFLDEVGNTPAAVQPMLLRVLETGEYRPLGAAHDVRSSARLITATDQNLYDTGFMFNQALLCRLESFTIHLPPLRERREDIGTLIAHLLASSNLSTGVELQLPASLIAQFILYDWPGNVRQLTHAVNRLLLLLPGEPAPDFYTLVDARADAARIRPATGALSSVARASAVSGRRRLVDLTQAEILAAMEKNDWHIQGAAQTLGISRPSMYKLLEAHPQIRNLDSISLEEIRQAMVDCGGNVERCASRLKTPAEPLRRYLRVL